MTMLEFQHVSLQDERGGLALNDVSFQMLDHEHVVIFGQAHSGRTTLLRVAAGLDVPDHGCVRFDGEELQHREQPVLGRGVSFAHRDFAPGNQSAVVEHVALALHILRVPLDVSRIRAHAALDRVDAGRFAEHRPGELTQGEVVRVSIARALVSMPRLLLLDDPADGVSLRERDAILRLVRSLRDDGIAVLATTSDAGDLRAADRGLNMSSGELHGETMPSGGRVVTLQRRASSG